MTAISAVCAAICSRCVAALAAVRVARDAKPVTELDTTADRDTWDGRRGAPELAALRVVIDGRRTARDRENAIRAETLRTAYLAQTATREGDDA